MTHFQRSYQIDYFFGWRYLFSAKFRDRVKQKLGNNLMLRGLFLIGSFTGMLLTSAVAILLIMAILHLAS